MFKLKINLDARLEQTSGDDERGTQPVVSIRVVLQQDRARVQHVPDVEHATDADAAIAECLGHTEVELVDTIAKHRGRLDERDVGSAGCEIPAESLDLCAVDRVVGLDLRTGSALERGAEIAAR